MTEVVKKLPGFRVMKLNPITMVFKDEELENEFKDDFYAKSIDQVRISFFLALLLYAFYAVFDLQLMPDQKELIWLIRFGGILPIGFLVLVTSFDVKFENYREVTFAFALGLYGLGIMIMLVVSPKPIDFVYYASLIVTFIFIYVFTGFRFIYATVCSFSLLLVYQYVEYFILDTPHDIISKNNVLFVSTNIIGMFASFSLEFYSRRDFYITKIIDNQRILLSENNNFLEQQVSYQNQKIEIVNMRMEDVLASSIAGLSAAIEVRDPYTVGHQKRVGKLAKLIGEKMKLSEFQLKGLVYAAECHDLGKICIPLELLAKSEELTKGEFEFLKQHSKAGYDILDKIDFPWPIADIVLGHHEKIDGSGYPNGLKGDEIMLESKILCVSDVMEAISSNRPYRVGLGIKAGLHELKKRKGIHYDPQIVDICIDLFENEGFKFDD